jgi:hypothetical protein
MKYLSQQKKIKDITRAFAHKPFVTAYVEK